MPVNVLDKLMYWTKDETLLQFVNNVLREANHDEVKLNGDNVGKAQKVVEKCFVEQQQDLTKACVPFLEKLDCLVARLRVEGQDGSESLTKTIKEAGL